MRTRNSNFPNNSNVTIPRRQNKGRALNIVEPELRIIVAPMAERTMEEQLRAPTEGYGEAIVLLEINADHFEIKTNLLQLVQANPFHEPPNSILTWEDLVTKFVNQFFPPSKTTHLKNKISRFTQKFDESFSEAWERFKEMLRACPHHGFTELTQVDTFYNGLNDNDQDSLNAAAGGNLLSKTTREALNIIENKSKVRYSRNKPNASRMNTTSRESDSKTDERIDKLADQLSTLVEIVSKKVVTPAPVKAVEETCVTCGGAHSWYNCPTTDNNQASVCATTGTYNQVNPPNRVSNQMAPPGFAPVQNNGQNSCNLRDGNEQIIFHVNGTTKHPQKHVNESIKMVNNTCKDSFKKFTDEPALVCLPPSEDDNDKKEKQEVKNLAESTAKRQTRITPCLKNFRVICKESIFHSNKTPQVSSVFAITSTLPSIEPKDSLIMGDDHLSTFSAEEIVLIPRESEDTSRSDSKNVLPSCDDFSSINVPRDDSVTFSNPLFEFDVNFNSSDINPLFDEVLEDIECKDSYDSNLDESTFLVTPLSDSNKDECLAPGDDIEILLHHDPSTPMKSIASILEGFIDDPPFEENDDLFDLECKTNDWKRILYDAPIDKAKCFDPGGDNDEIDAFLAIEVPTYIEEGYYDSEGDVIYLESLLSDDTTHNLSSEVFFDHEAQHDTFSPKSDPLHHEFIDIDSNREEIDIFSGPDDSIPPGIESDFDSKEDVIDNLLNDDPIPEYKRLTFDMEPHVPIINNVNKDECFDPGEVRMLQKPQENGQNRTNTDMGKERVQKSQKFLANGQLKVKLGQLVNHKKTKPQKFPK
ncbi:reverse transcriptase domain-containing protein [Tanacetum coccineum]